jgi:sarcosine oxidase subunit gamma
MHKPFSDGGCIIRVQAWDLGTATPTKVAELSSVAWPRETGTVIDAHAVGTVICVSPAEWLVLDGTLQSDQTLEILGEAFEGSGFRTANVSQSLARFRIEGGAACRVLGKGCALDLDAATFRVGSAARTRLAGIPVVVWRKADFEFECLLARSYDEYFRSWLRDAALEFDGVA